MKITQAFIVTIATLTAGSAIASPSASCASKFIGVWRHYGPFGITNKATLTADGQAKCDENVACRTEGSWTCNGNVMTYTTSAGPFTYTSKSATEIDGPNSSIRMVRIGAAPGAPAKDASQGPTVCASQKTHMDKVSNGEMPCIDFSNTCARPVVFTYIYNPPAVRSMTMRTTVAPGKKGQFCGSPGGNVVFSGAQMK